MEFIAYNFGTFNPGSKIDHFIPAQYFIGIRVLKDLPQVAAVFPCFNFLSIKGRFCVMLFNFLLYSRFFLADVYGFPNSSFRIIFVGN